MTFKELDTVVLLRDLAGHSLCAGDLGAIVLVHSPDAFEVEFADAGGVAHAIVTVGPADIRPISDTDVMSVRPR